MSIDLIAEYEEHLRDLDRSIATIEAYVPTLRRIDNELPQGLLQATEGELKSWLNGNDWSKSTRHLRRSAITGFFEFVCDPRRSPRLDFNPATYLPKVKVPRRYPRPAPTEAVHDAIKQSPPDIRGAYILSAYAGARCIEIADLNKSDISKDETLLHGKGDKFRVVPTHPLVWAWAQELAPGPAFADRWRHRRTRQQISHLANWWLTKLGHPAVTIHMFRHWFGTNAFSSTLDLRVVQELLGHASIATTQLYVQASKKRMTQAVEGLPDLT